MEKPIEEEEEPKEEKLSGWQTHSDKGLNKHVMPGVGCFGLLNEVALYEKMMLIGSQHYSTIFPISDVDVSFTVRNGKDPMLAAKELSGNSFDFGLSSHDMAAAGFLGLMISLLLLCRPCIVICSIRRIPRYQDILEKEKNQIYDPEIESAIRRRSALSR